MKAYVEYYSRHNISPVGQDISDMERHLRRRDGLYRSLGLAPALLAGRDVLEFGPGGGHNPLHTHSLRPARYVLVDANPTGLAETKQRLAGGDGLEFHLSLIEDYADDRRFDVVLCEGLLAFQENPEAILDKAASFVKPGGVLVVTCQDSVSSASDFLRTAIGKALRDPSLPLVGQAKKLAPIFQAHFANLPGMSRPVEDWILDNVLQPFYFKRLYSIADALRFLDAEFHLYGSSPRYLADWRWYKDAYAKGGGYNARALASHYRNMHNLLDFRVVYPSRPERDNLDLLAIADDLLDACRAVDGLDNAAAFDGVACALSRMADNILLLGEAAEATAKPLRDAARGVLELPSRREQADFGAFAAFFGRGQQYLSLVRDS